MPRLSKDKEIPTAIRNLKLCFALRNCGEIAVADAFDKSCVEYLYVYDDNNLGYTDWDDMEPDFVSKCFMAINPNNNTIVLLPLDGRIITGKNVVTGGVCDGMLLTAKEMCLLEFKTNVVSLSYQTVIQRANEAIGQLWHTFNNIIKPKCDSKSNNIESLLSVVFHIVFDKDLEITAVNSELMDLQTEFLEVHKYQLYFDSKKVFQ